MKPSLRDTHAIIHRRLLPWFARHARDLPWRANRDPYSIWVSEVMLQQTQVAAVIPYFERFLARFPTLFDLAEASERDVLLLWEGLGYYRRARDLHRAARLIASEHGGVFPSAPDILRRLPGFGRYTVGAVLSQAFDRRLPIVEANSQRVLSRLFAKQGDARSPAFRAWLWQSAEELLPRRKVGTFNQALMELGALICTAKNPQCSLCPLRQACAAQRRGTPEAFPGPSKRSDTIAITEIAVVVRRGTKVLLVQRPPAGRWASLWEFPHAPLSDGQAWETSAARMLADLTGIRARLGAELLTVRHGVTNHAITLVAILATYQSGRFQSSFYTQAKWLEPCQLDQYPVSVPQRKLAQHLVGLRRQVHMI